MTTQVQALIESIDSMRSVKDLTDRELGTLMRCVKQLAHTVDAEHTNRVQQFDSCELIVQDSERAVERACRRANVVLQQYPRASSRSREELLDRIDRIRDQSRTHIYDMRMSQRDLVLFNYSQRELTRLLDAFAKYVDELEMFWQATEL